MTLLCCGLVFFTVELHICFVFGFVSPDFVFIETI